MVDRRFDVFLSYNSTDRTAVEQLARRLEGERLKPWLDGWNLTPGSPWQDEIVESLRDSAACAVIVGPAGLGNWAREELAVALDRAAKDRSFRIFMVLLPGAPELPDPMVAFLRSRTWVDLRAGVGDPDGLRDLVCAVTGAPRARLVAIAPGACPYRGLEVFEESHADLFFGREDDVALLVDKLRTRRFLAVLGPSGCGKSSLLRAGLVPALRHGALPGSDAWAVRVFTPGPRPLTSLAAQVASLDAGAAMQQTLDQLGDDQRSLDLAVSLGSIERPGRRSVFVVDQLEELFTLCDDETEREAFLANLLYAAAIPGGRVVVVAGMRADFYDRCARYEHLRALVADSQFLVGSLDAAGLRRAVEEPAHHVELDFEGGLVETILSDAGDRPGALPLLEHVLLELWQRRRGPTMTLEAYVAAGGVHGALANRANAVFAGLDAAQQDIARDVLLRLVQPGEDADDTRRRAEMSELVNRPGGGDVEAVVDAFAGQRLLTVGRDEVSGARVVDIAHEALIRAWPELRGWIGDAREELRAQRHLTGATTEWSRGGRRDEDVYRGARLAYWSEQGDAGLTEDEQAFLAASRAGEARQREAGGRRARRAVGGILAAVTTVAVVAVVGFWQVSNQRDVASSQRDIALSRDLVNKADARRDSDPQLAALLGLAASRLNDSPETRGSLLNGVVRTRGIETVLGEHAARVNTVAFSPDGRLLASADADGRVALWDVTKRTRVATLTGSDEAVASVAFSPDGRTMATAGLEGRVILWDVAERRQLVTLTGNTKYATSVAFSPDGATLAVGGVGSEAADGEVVLWDVAGRRQSAVLRGHVGVSVAFSPDGRTIATGGPDSEVSLWDLATRAQAATLTGHRGLVFQVAFSPDGTILASASDSEDGLRGEVKLWDVAQRRELERPQVVFGRRSVAFSPDGASVAWASDHDLELGHIADNRPEDSFHGHSDKLLSIAFSPDGHTLASGGTDRKVILWDVHDGLAPGTVLDGVEPVDDFAFSPDWRTLATIESASRAGQVSLWDVATRTKLGTLADDGVRSVSFYDRGRSLVTVHEDQRTHGLWDVATRTRVGTLTTDRPPSSGAMSPDGRVLATGHADGSLTLWDVGTGARIGELTGHTKAVTSVEFSPDGRTLASGGDDAKVFVWDVGTRTQAAKLTGHTDGVSSVAFSPDGRTLASGSADTRVLLWDVRKRAQVGALPVDEPVFAAVFSPDGRTLASQGSGDTVLWDLATRAKLAGLGDSSVPGLVFSADGRRLATRGNGLVLYDLDVGTWRRRLCDIVGRDFTTAEQATYLQGRHLQLCG